MKYSELKVGDVFYLTGDASPDLKYLIKTKTGYNMAGYDLDDSLDLTVVELSLLQKVQFCANVMGYDYMVVDNDCIGPDRYVLLHSGEYYWPIVNDKQAKELCEKFRMLISYFDISAVVEHPIDGILENTKACSNISINHAIVESVVKYHLLLGNG